MNKPDHVDKIIAAADEFTVICADGWVYIHDGEGTIRLTLPYSIWDRLTALPELSRKCAAQHATLMRQQQDITSLKKLANRRELRAQHYEDALVEITKMRTGEAGDAYEMQEFAQQTLDEVMP